MAKKRYLEAGQIVSTHGVRGEMRVQPWCDSPEVFATLKTLYLDEDGTRPVKVKSHPHKTIALMKMQGVDTVQDAAAMRGQMLYLDRKDVRLEKGAHFICDLIGLQVRDADSGEVYGTLTEVSSTGANDVYHMDMNGREILIPAIPPVIIEINVDDGYMRIRPLAGLFD